VKIEVYERFKDYDKEHCWQYQIRLDNLKDDLKEAGLTKKEASKLKISDFDFVPVVEPAPVELCGKCSKEQDDDCGCKAAPVELCGKCSKEQDDDCGCKAAKDQRSALMKEYLPKRKEVSDFIHAHEWLGKMPNRPTHRFTARLKKNNALAGVVVMAVPNTFSNLLGKEHSDKEKLISRGACISWSPKNLGSWLIMKSIKWMAKNTKFRYFTAYSDPEAKELGTIYQACNFYYLGQGTGTIKQYYDPNKPKVGWFSDREFRKKSKYQKYAENLGITKEIWKLYQKKYSPNWNMIEGRIVEENDPNSGVVEKHFPKWTEYQNFKDDIKNEERAYKNSCKERHVMSKHKYVYILGASKKETKFYKKMFFENNKKRFFKNDKRIVGKEFDYPKIRGDAGEANQKKNSKTEKKGSKKANEISN